MIRSSAFATTRLYVERGGDELNLIEAGTNYGWPLASYATNYNGVPGPDGALWMLEDANPGGLFRVTPKQPASK